MSRARLVALLAALAGCSTEDLASPPASSPTGGVTAPSLCDSAPEAVVPADVRIDAFDANPAEVFAAATGVFTGELDTGDVVPLTLDIDANVSEYRFTDRTWRGSGADPDADACRPTLEASFAALIDADGVLNCSFSASFVADPEALTFASPIPTESIVGSLSPADANVTALQVTALLDPAAFEWSGSLAWQGPDATNDAVAGDFWAIRSSDGE